NHYTEMKRISVDLEAGKRYHLGQRFFPTPYEGGPFELIFDVVIDTAVLPFMLLFPPEEPEEAPTGEYFSWVRNQRSEKVLAGLPPDVPLAHEAITYVPIEEPAPAP
ncbi:MAG: hypothetical protein O7G85_06160, partial [Planctomycetota bacterium]|nr:hypothetical protein [Planctomycetota bacterium]